MTGENELRRAVIMLEMNYIDAQKLRFVMHPMAWALYQTWKCFDREAQKKEEQHESNT